VKAIRCHPNVPAEVRAIEQKAAMTVLEAIHRYAETGARAASNRSAASSRECFASASAITVSSSMRPPTPSPFTAFSTGKTLTAERRPAQNTAGQTRIRGKSGADQNTPFVLVDKTPKAKLRDGAS
jgi:hypothetical protein